MNAQWGLLRPFKRPREGRHSDDEVASQGRTVCTLMPRRDANTRPPARYGNQGCSRIHQLQGKVFALTFLTCKHVPANFKPRSRCVSFFFFQATCKTGSKVHSPFMEMLFLLWERGKTRHQPMANMTCWVFFKHLQRFHCLLVTLVLNLKNVFVYLLEKK